MTPEIKPEFATNRDGQTVGGAIAGHLEYLLGAWAQPPEVAIASAYFNPGGFGVLANQLERVGHVRLLLGAEPLTEIRGPRRLANGGLPQQAEAAAVRRALEDHTDDLRRDRDLLGFEPEVDEAAQRLIAWLGSGGVEVRRYARGFLHGKAFIVTTDHEGVIAGSANFTTAGLLHNMELTLGQYQPTPVKEVIGWFDALWERAAPFDLAAVYEARYAEHGPETIYLRMLYERYGAEVFAEARGTTAGLHLTRFQEDGVWRARRILEQHNGVVVADGVGLGKTYVAGSLIRDAVQRARQRVLVIAPAALRDGPWETFLTKQDLPRSVQCISFDQLIEDVQFRGPDGHRHLRYDVDEYALVVIDEAHGFRNPDTLRAEALRRLLAGSPPKDVVMLTATPVNNNLFDLYYLLSYFIHNDAEFADAGIRSLRQHFNEATAEDPEDLSAERLFDVLDAVAVRRTRHFVKTYYANDRVYDNDGNLVPITFPTVEVMKTGYDLDALNPGFFHRLGVALAYEPGEGNVELVAGADEQPLTLARYSPSRYRKAGEADAYQLQIAGLLRSGLLKRFESSAHAFALTCRRMAASHDKFIALMDQGRVATGSALADWTVPETDEFDQMGEVLLADSEDVALYDADALRSAVEADRDLLVGFADEADQITPDRDPKLAALVDELAAIAAQARADASDEAQERDNRKVIVFSYYTDTVDWIRSHLETVLESDERLTEFRGRMTTIDGHETSDKTRVLYGFAPRSAEAPTGLDEDKYDLLISTDVLAEGVNLQQARNIVNYDLPWNPMRLVQRHGRIDRIGSTHRRVYVRCFLPDAQLDAILGLEERLKRKLHQAAAAVGIENEVLPGSKVNDVVFSETREEIERLRSGDATLFETAGERGHAYSGEEYRQELRRALEDQALREPILALPWGSGSGLARAGAAPGFVFCVRVGDHPKAIYRYVSMADLAAPEVVRDTLACLAHAYAARSTARALSDEMHLLAYQAWALARDDIYGEWTKATDPRELAPKVPRVLREAADLLRRVQPDGITRDQVTERIDALEAPYPARIQTAIRRALAGGATEAERASLVADEVARLGLEASPPPQPLPLIEPGDVHLVCWQAIAPDE